MKMKTFFICVYLFLFIFACAQQKHTKKLKKETDNFHFAVLSDRTGGANHKEFETVLENIKNLSPDLVVNAGDLASNGENWDKVMESMKKIWVNRNWCGQIL